MGKERPATPEHSSVAAASYLQVKALHTKALLLQLQLSMHINGNRMHALVDTGAMGNFVSPEFVRRVGAELTPLKHPRPILAADGMQMCTCTHTARVTAKLARAIQVELEFYVVPISSDAIVGLPWLRDHDGDVHTAQHQITVTIGRRRVTLNCKNPRDSNYSTEDKPQLISVQSI